MSDINSDENKDPFLLEEVMENQIDVEPHYNNVLDQNIDNNLECSVINACMAGHLEVIEEYVKQHGINDFLYTGWTLLLYAASFIQLELVEYLLRHGADPNKRKDHGFTPLMALCNSTVGNTKNFLKCLKLLIEVNADTNVTNSQRETPLMYACKSQNAEVVAELIKHVKDINACDYDGRTALSYAVTANKPDIVRILLEYNANTSLVDRYNLTAKGIADTKGFTEISDLLTEEEEEILTICEISQITSWKDLFLDLYPINEETLDYDISVVLYGMGLEKYGVLFEGMNLKTFLQLTEDDLLRLGIDISTHREQFLENLEKFHCKKWYSRSVGSMEKSRPYTIYDGVMSLGIAKKQISVIASSFQYIRNNLIEAASENIHLSPTQKIAYKQEMQKTQNTLKILKQEVMHIKKLAQKIDKENKIDLPPSLIKLRPRRYNPSHWPITLSITLVIGLYFWKTTH